MFDVDMKLIDHINLIQENTAKSLLNQKRNYCKILDVSEQLDIVKINTINNSNL